jgi:hypothetical protein
MEYVQLYMYLLVVMGELYVWSHHNKLFCQFMRYESYLCIVTVKFRVTFPCTTIRTHYHCPFECLRFQRDFICGLYVYLLM